MLRGSRFFLLGAIALFIMANMPSAQSFWCISNNTTASALSDSAINSCLIATAVPYVAIALLLSFAIIALAYVLGEVLGIASLKSWYKLELWEITKTLLLVIVVFSAIIIIGAIAVSLNGGSSTANNFGTMYFNADAYLTNQYTISQNAFNNMLGIYMGISYLTSFRFDTYYFYRVMTMQYADAESDPPCAPSTTGPIFLPYPATCPYILPDLTSIGGQIYTSCPGAPILCEYLGTVNIGSDENILQSDVLSSDVVYGKGLNVDSITLLIVPVELIMAAQATILPYLAFAGLGVFLPLGIILRAIPFLRGVGGTLLSLGLAFALIYPGTIVALNIPITNAVVTGVCNGYVAYYCYAPPTVLGGNCDFWGLNSIGSICALFTQEISSLGFITPFEALFGGATSPFGLGYQAAVNGAFNGALPVVDSSLSYTMPVVVQLLLLIIDLIVIYALTNGVAKLLGGTIKLGIGKMKLT